MALFRDPDYTTMTVGSAMKVGNWLAPRYPGRGVFEKDFPKIDLSPIEVYCPGCKASVRIGRKALNGRIGGWCKKCDRGVAP